MFYQHSDNLPWIGWPTWGHAISDDLMTWEELPSALYPDELGAVYSGSCIVDTNNTSEFFAVVKQK